MDAAPPATVLITGASSGLGRGLALHYAMAGAVVHALARREAALEALAAEVAAGGGPGRVVPIAVDVSDAEAQVAAIRAAESQSGGALDLVIANAGIREPTPATDMNWRVVKRVLDVNVSAAAVTIAASLPAMVARGRGTVVAMSSLAAFRGLRRNAAYSASKAALHTFMESVRVDLAGTGVKAITIYPGYVRTEMTARNPHPRPFLMELDDAVEVMAKGIAKGQPVLTFPFPLTAVVRALAAVPRAIYEPLAGRARGR